MKNKAVGLIGCCRMFLVVVAIGLTPSLKAEANTNLLVMELDVVANIYEACLGSHRWTTAAIKSQTSPQCHEDTFGTQKALHDLIGNTSIASENLPVIVLASYTLWPGHFSWRREVPKVNVDVYISDTFGVDVKSIKPIPDMAVSMKVDDHYNKHESWAVEAKLIERHTPWGPGGIHKVSRDIYLVSLPTVCEHVSGHWYKLFGLIRVINMALEKSMHNTNMSQEAKTTVHTIGNNIRDLVGRSIEGHILFSDWNGVCTLRDANRHVWDLSHIRGHLPKPVPLSPDMFSKMEADGKLQFKPILIMMKPFIGVEGFVTTSTEWTSVKQLFTGCLLEIPKRLIGGAASISSGKVDSPKYPFPVYEIWPKF
eukprot:GHVS01058112.1.p1 GENE.GHVS01058112.1~~GHVS01058112.1.p1  ORF type:complete len:368 (+),score=16.24 GHVS01058112.1:137-1240(+)